MSRAPVFPLAAVVFGKRGDGACQKSDFGADFLDDLVSPGHLIFEHARKVTVDIPNMVAGCVVEVVALTGFGEPLEYRPKLSLIFRQPDHQLLLRPHLIRHRGQTVGQGHEALVAMTPRCFSLRHGALQVIERVCCGLEERLDISRDRLIAFAATQWSAAGDARGAAQPVLQVIVEPVLCSAGLQLQKAEQQ